MANTFSSSSILLSFFVATVLVGGCSAIYCASCFSAVDKDCLNKPDLEKFKTDCSIDPAGRNVSCQKILQKLEGETDYRVTRQCSNVMRYECIERVGTRGVRAWYCHCNNEVKDGVCNGASGLSVAFSSLLLVGVAVALAKFDR